MLVDIERTADKGRVIRLMEPLEIRFRWRPKQIVPPGFQSDGASVPRLFWRLVFPRIDEKSLRGAIAHDYIYRTHPEGWDKEDADEMFYEFMIDDGVPKFRAWLAYQGVVWFGWLAWKTKGEW